ncbi:hypothetical protein [Bradyrhizobium yuanmingense]|uniref:hypothetical protein n=1 Tax=Bradyrhizobium yuanmingense TaxID=108015 RepID=UPI0023B91A45|nr:hypothetical protein [Bradyrhizobium yuanmingense]MDF0499074.1 hypothetical protein [Bradyrhizobium yuanmingense]
MWLLQFLGMLAFLFGICYFVAAMGNHGRYVQRPENNLGCAIILFIPVLIWVALMAISAMFGR